MRLDEHDWGQTVPALVDNATVTRLGWRQLVERSWQELVAAGLPVELAELAGDVSNLTRRPVLVYTMPLEQAGVSGLAVPFVYDDGVVLDPSLLSDPTELAEIVAHELAHVLYPGWSGLERDQHDEMEAFARVLGPVLLDQLPSGSIEVATLVVAALEQCRHTNRVRRGGGLAS
jgi:predicted Zn-dependent protease